jgi:hypothetical protein
MTWTRRELLQRAACGFGYLAFAGLAAQASASDNPLAPKATASSTASKAGHFPVHARRPFTRRYIRLQAETPAR